MSHNGFNEIFNKSLTEFYDDFCDIDASKTESNKNIQNEVKGKEKYISNNILSFIKKSGKKIAVILIALNVLFVGEISANALKEEFAEYIQETAENYKEKTDKIDEEYILNYVPEGFELKDKENRGYEIHREYINSSDELIVFLQRNDDSGENEDNKLYSLRVNFQKNNINEKKVTLAFYDNFISASWKYDKYDFEIIFFGSFSENEIIETISSVQSI